MKNDWEKGLLLESYAFLSNKPFNNNYCSMGT